MASLPYLRRLGAQDALSNIVEEDGVFRFYAE